MTADLLKPYVFVAMPYGEKTAHDGKTIDFDAVYKSVFREALEDRFAVFRADADERAGNVLTDMFQELLIADLVLVDVSVDNANVWYELGVRHALRARGVLLIRGIERPLPFDIRTERVFRYHLTDDKPRQPDPDKLADDRANLLASANATLESWLGRKDSPVYERLPALKEPNWRDLRVGGMKEYWEQLDGFEDRVKIARAKRKPGDILLLADEVPNRALKLEALQLAGRALNSLGTYDLAVQTFDRALALLPDDVLGRQQRALALGRLGKLEKARQELHRLAETDGSSGETLGLLGRVTKDQWTASFDQPSADRNADLKTAATAQESRLLAAARAYASAFRTAPADFFPGINALTLTTLWRHLTGRDPLSEDCNLDIERLRGGVGWGVHCALQADREDYWALASAAEMALLGEGEPDDTVRLYRKAAQSSSATWFMIDSSRQQVVLLNQLGWRRDVCAQVLSLLDEEIEHHRPGFEPRKVVLFAGHMLDRPGRTEPRFPADKAEAAAERIGHELDALKVGEQDLAISGAACGGDTLFLEAALQRGMRATVHLPKTESAFLVESVSFAGPEWVRRYRDIKADNRVEMRCLPEELGDAPQDVGSHARNSVWLIYSALAHGLDSVDCLLLWDGKGGDGPGGTGYMADEFRRITGHAPRIIAIADL